MPKELVVEPARQERGRESAPGGDLRKFLKRLSIFVAPFLVYAAVIVLVDPYNLFNVSPLIPDQVKKPISNLNYPLWKMSEFRRRPMPNVLLGDSRMGAIRAERVSQVAGEDYYNFAYGGATLQEIVHTFWFADSLTRLRNVYIGINFNLYNALERGDRTEDYSSIARNPLRYFVHPSVLEATWYDIGAVLGANVKIGVPNMTRDRFWRHQLEVTARQMYRRYEYPEKDWRELGRIADHCRSQGIRVAFIIFPTHTDLQARVADFGLQAEQEHFRRDLTNLAPTFDYDFPNHVTQNQENFKDPFHFREEIMELLVQDVWGGKCVLPRRRPDDEHAIVSGESAEPRSSAPEQVSGKPPVSCFP